MVIVMLYTSIENKKIKELKKLNTKKYRDLNNLFIIEGEHLVLEAYKKGKTLEKAQKKIKEVAGSLENLTDKEQFAIEQYLNSLRELLAYCKEPTDAESGMQLKEQAKNHKYVVAEIAKEKYIANYAK